jgi:GT2 family glycosyltransferase
MTHNGHAVVVAYHAPGDLDRSLAAFDNAAPVTVVDNSSSPTVRAVAERHGAEYIDAEANVGFAAGVNIALRRFDGRTETDILLLNPDAMLAPRDLHRLSEFLHRLGNERVAAVSPRLVGSDGESQRVVWPFPTPGRAWAEAAGFGGLPAKQTFVIGAVLLLRWKAIHEVGLFDERFFLYAEETDWQRRANALGWRSAVCTGAVAEHIGAGTSESPLRREALFHAGQETYIRKWHGRTGWWLYRCAACCGAAGRALVLRGEPRANAARRALLYIRGPRRCAGLV